VTTVWDDTDGCKHSWSSKLIGRQRQRSGAFGGLHEGRSINKLEDIVQTEYPQGTFCSKCGCWRGQLGLEPTWQLYIEHLCECAREWWRVLKPTGNLFVNIGDTFAGSQTGHTGPPPSKWPTRCGEIPKMKLGIPYRLRFALNDMGWVSRDDLIWYKGVLL